MSKLIIEDDNFQEYMNCQPRWEQDLLDDLQWMVLTSTIQNAITSGNSIFAIGGWKKHNNAFFA